MGNDSRYRQPNRQQRNNNDNDDSNRPWGSVYFVVDNGEGNKSTWIELGPAWRIKGGFKVRLQKLPIALFAGGATPHGLDLVVQERKERE